MRLTVKDTAKDDLINIRKYISDELQNPVAAENTVKKISNSISQLKDNPYIGTLLHTKTDFPYSYRFLPSGTYIIIYKLYKDCDKVLRVYNGHQDYIRDIFRRFAEYEEEDKQ